MKINMILVKNKILPFGHFKALAIWPFLFYKGSYPTFKTIRHERIHFAQQKELLIILFYILYVFLWMIYGYRDNPLEAEAYANDRKPDYLKSRKMYNWINYFKKL